MENKETFLKLFKTKSTIKLEKKLKANKKKLG